jgi:phosphoribosylanthranilate isomerase
MGVRVKICGITNLKDAEAAVAAGADALGFILFEKSKRFIAMEEAIRIVEGLPPFVTTVAVTVNAMREFTNLGWRKQLKHFGVAQLHGEESPVHVKAVGKYLPVIKVFPADQARTVTPGQYEVAAFMLDTPADLPVHMRETINKLETVRTGLDKKLARSASVEEISKEASLPVEQVRAVLRTSADFPAERGGTGRVFDWTLAVDFKTRIGAPPLVLSGGLGPENVAKAIEAVHPYAVDVASGVEASPGRKDHAKLRDFIQICKSC